MVNVFITVDTEVWPRSPNWRSNSLYNDLKRDIYGVMPEGEFGIIYQMKMLNEYGLKAVFFVEPLFACEVGFGPLSLIIEAIQKHGHDVQLHIHTEWLQHMQKPIFPFKGRRNLNDYTEDEQFYLIAQGIENLKKCGVRDICAFRAGNFGANFDTVRALKRSDIIFDSSYNFCFLKTDCDMDTKVPLLQPQIIDSVYEFPVSFFQDFPSHYRHAQLCACSSQELEDALLSAWQHRWFAFVIVTHSFELVNRKRLRVSGIVRERFSGLCLFLAENSTRFVTRKFSDLDVNTIPNEVVSEPIKVKPLSTAKRYYEQLLSRII